MRSSIEASSARVGAGAGSKRSLALPVGSQKLEFYFHVKTYLVADYSKFTNVGWRKYEQAQRILVRETWDNDHGAGTNYTFATEPK